MRTVQKGKLIEQCLGFLADDLQKGLAGSFGRRATALVLHSQLEPVINVSDVEEIVVLIKLAKLAGLREKVTSHCLMLEKTINRRRYFGIQERGKILCLEGDLEEGLALLSTIPSRRRTQHVSNTIREAQLALDRAAAGKQVRRLIRKDRKKSATEEEKHAILETVARCSEGRDFRFSLSRMIGLGVPSEARRVEKARVELCPIFCSGFGWSGSGAVFDYLSDYSPDAFSISTHVEIRLLRSGRYGLPKLLRTIDSTAEKKRAALREFLLKGFLGLPDGTELPLEVRQIADKSVVGSLRANTDAEFYRKLDHELSIFMEVYLAADSVSFEVREAFNRVFSVMMAPFQAIEQKSLLLNNAILAKQPEAATFFEGMRMVGVMRDPRDIYTTRVVQAGWSHSVEKFIEVLVTGLARFSSYSATRSNSVRLIRFEEFVLNESIRSGLLEWLGAGNAIRTGQLFNAEQSARNIGIYREFPDKVALKKIEVALPEWCLEPG